MKETLYGDLSVIGMRGCEKFAEQVDGYLKEWRRHGGEDTYLAHAVCSRFGSGEGKATIQESMRGQDVYIFCDMFNHSITYKMFGQDQRMSPDDHYADLKRIIAAIGARHAASRSSCPCCTRGASTSVPRASLWTAQSCCRSWSTWA